MTSVLLVQANTYQSILSELTEENRRLTEFTREVLKIVGI